VDTQATGGFTDVVTNLDLSPLDFTFTWNRVWLPSTSDSLKLNAGITAGIFAFNYTWVSRLAAATEAGVSDDAYLLIFGEDTGVHGILQTNLIPLSESERIIGAGDKWVITQYFNTSITPNSSTDATNYRIARIANVT